MWDSTVLGEEGYSHELWDPETGETIGAALLRFQGIAPRLVHATHVPELIEAGIQVWSFGYGDDPDWFTTIDIDDMAVDPNGREDWDNGLNEQVWGPFAIAQEHPLSTAVWPLNAEAWRSYFALGTAEANAGKFYRESTDEELDEFSGHCRADDEMFDTRYDLTHEEHDSEHPNHHKFCDMLYASHWHEGTDGTPETVRFDPQGAIERLRSFVSIFDNDGVTDTVTLDQAINTLEDAVREAADARP